MDLSAEILLMQDVVQPAFHNEGTARSAVQLVSECLRSDRIRERSFFALIFHAAPSTTFLC